MISRLLRTVIPSIALIVLLSPPSSPARSSFFMMQIVGDFNSWDDFAPAMTQISSTQWADTLNMNAGCTLLKFRTDFTWNNNLDYGRCSGEETPCQLLVPADTGTPLVEPTCLVDVFPGNALGELEFPVEGSYEFLLDEALGQYSIRYLGEPTPMGSISGVLAFSDEPLISPLVYVFVMETASGDLAGMVENPPDTDTFLVENIPTGHYYMWFASNYYEDLIVENVVVSAPENTDIGTVTMTSFLNISSSVQVLGDFNDWNIEIPPMSHPTATTWVDTLYVPAGCSLIKFRTNDVWNDDYCRCTGIETPCESPVPASGALVLDVCTGSGTGNALGEIEFPESAEYEFLLDEENHTCTIRRSRTVPIESSSWGRLKALFGEQ